MRRIYTISYSKEGKYPRPVLCIDCIGEPENTYEHTTTTPDVVKIKDRRYYQVNFVDNKPVVEARPIKEVEAEIEEERRVARLDEIEDEMIEVKKDIDAADSLSLNNKKIEKENRLSELFIESNKYYKR